MNENFNSALLLGAAAILSAILGFAIGASFNTGCTSAAWTFGCFEHYFDRYQTLTAGLLALIGAVLTIGEMRQQARRAAVNEAERRLLQSRVALDRLRADYNVASAQNVNFDSLWANGNAIAAAQEPYLGLDRTWIEFLIAQMRLSLTYTGKARTDLAKITIWPTYVMLRQSIEQRRILLRTGAAPVYLEGLSLVDGRKIFQRHLPKEE